MTFEKPSYNCFHCNKRMFKYPYPREYTCLNEKCIRFGKLIHEDTARELEKKK